MLEMLSSQPPAAAPPGSRGDREGERQDLGDHEELDVTGRRCANDVETASCVWYDSRSSLQHCQSHSM